jgi:acyl carrier protein
VSHRALRTEVLGVVREALAVILERDPDSIRPESRLADLGADSLARVELADQVEARYAGPAGPVFRLPDADLGRIETVGEAVDLVLAHL